MPLKYTYNISGTKDIGCEQMRQDGDVGPSVLAITVVFIEDTKICQLEIFTGWLPQIMRSPSNQISKCVPGNGIASNLLSLLWKTNGIDSLAESHFLNGDECHIKVAIFLIIFGMLLNTLNCPNLPPKLVVGIDMV